MRLLKNCFDLASTNEGMLGGKTLSKVIDWKMDNSILFGDGAGGVCGENK